MQARLIQVRRGSDAELGAADHGLVVLEKLSCALVWPGGKELCGRPTLVGNPATVTTAIRAGGRSRLDPDRCDGHRQVSIPTHVVHLSCAGLPRRRGPSGTAIDRSASGLRGPT